MVYTIEQLRERITPVAEKYQLRAVYLFGSYAKGEATDDSDVDILVDRTDSIVIRHLLSASSLKESPTQPRPR